MDATAWTLPSSRLSKDLVEATEYFLGEGEEELPYSFESVGVTLHFEKYWKATVYSNPTKEQNTLICKLKMLSFDKIQTHGVKESHNNNSNSFY